MHMEKEWNMKKGKTILALIAVICSLMLWACGSTALFEETDYSSQEEMTDFQAEDEATEEIQTQEEETEELQTQEAGETDENPANVKEYKFRTQELLDSHYNKHGREFGTITKEQYLQGVNDLINSTGPNILTKTEEDGDTLIYNTDTNEFAVITPDNIIRTYFRPTDGIDYFNRQ